MFTIQVLDCCYTCSEKLKNAIVHFDFVGYRCDRDRNGNHIPGCWWDTFWFRAESDRLELRLRFSEKPQMLKRQTKNVFSPPGPRWDDNFLHILAISERFMGILSFFCFFFFEINRINPLSAEQKRTKMLWGINVIIRQRFKTQLTERRSEPFIVAYRSKIVSCFYLCAGRFGMYFNGFHPRY